MKSATQDSATELSHEAHTAQDQGAKLTTAASRRSRFYNSYASKTDRLVGNSYKKGEVALAGWNWL